MNNVRLLGILCACLLSLAITPAVGSVVYTYTGNVFSTFSDPTSYDNTKAITGTVEFAAPLGANNPYSPADTPISFSFSDGINTLTESNTTSGSGINSVATFNLQTDASGNIIIWDIELFTGWSTLDSGGTSVRIASVGGVFPSDSDIGDMRLCTSPNCVTQDSDFGRNDLAAGTWTMSAVPVPAAVWLFGSGLLGLIGIAKRKKAA